MGLLETLTHAMKRHVTEAINVVFKIEDVEAADGAVERGTGEGSSCGDDVSLGRFGGARELPAEGRREQGRSFRCSVWNCRSDGAEAGLS